MVWTSTARPPTSSPANVAGSGFTFTDAGEHELKGIPERYRLYTVH